MSRWFLAVDAGNSKTVAVVVDETGAVLGRARGGRGDIYNAASPSEASAEVLAAVRSALDQAGVPADQLDAAAFRLAGVDWPEDSAWWRQQITAELPALEKFSVLNDGFASLRLGRLDGIGLAITVGTGPAIAARSIERREACSGWWVLDSLGGWGLGENAVRAVCLEWMGLGEPTGLTEPLLELLGASSVWDLRHSFTRRDQPRSGDEMLSATRLVLDHAGQGDPVARALVTEQARAFGGYADWVARQVDAVPGAELPIILNGSVVTSDFPAMREALLGALGQRFPGCPVQVSDAPPLAGCILDALAEGGVTITAGLRQQVLAISHPADFLDT